MIQARGRFWEGLNGLDGLNELNESTEREEASGIESSNETLCKIAIGINAAVSQERPMGTGGVHFAEVERYDEDFIPFGAGLGEDIAGGAGDDALGPKLDAVAREFFVADTVGHGEVTA